MNLMVKNFRKVKFILDVCDEKFLNFFFAVLSRISFIACVDILMMGLLVPKSVESILSEKPAAVFGREFSVIEIVASTLIVGFLRCFYVPRLVSGYTNKLFEVRRKISLQLARQQVDDENLKNEEDLVDRVQSCISETNIFVHKLLMSIIDITLELMVLIALGIFLLGGYVLDFAALTVVALIALWVLMKGTKKRLRETGQKRLNAEKSRLRILLNLFGTNKSDATDESKFTLLDRAVKDFNRANLSFYFERSKYKVLIDITLISFFLFALVYFTNFTEISFEDSAFVMGQAAIMFRVIPALSKISASIQAASFAMPSLGNMFNRLNCDEK